MDPRYSSYLDRARSMGAGRRVTSSGIPISGNEGKAEALAYQLMQTDEDRLNALEDMRRRRMAEDRAAALADRRFGLEERSGNAAIEDMQARRGMQGNFMTALAGRMSQPSQWTMPDFGRGQASNSGGMGMSSDIENYLRRLIGGR